MYPDPSFRKLELALAIPEYKVPLKGGSRPSQNDVFAVIEAKRFHAKCAVMIVQSFVAADKDNHYGDYKAFISLYGVKSEKDKPYRLSCTPTSQGFSISIDVMITSCIEVSTVLSSARYCIRSWEKDARIPKQEGFHFCAILRNSLVQMQPGNSFIPST